METIKKNWKNILIVVLVLFSLTKCTQSCNRAGYAEQIEREYTVSSAAQDSVIKKLSDSCTVLNTTIKVYEERVSGMQQSIGIQQEAAKRISEAKRNINVTLKNLK